MVKSYTIEDMHPYVYWPGLQSMNTINRLFVACQESYLCTYKFFMGERQATLSMVRAMNTINKLFMARQESYLWPYINSIQTKVLFSINSL